MAAQGDDIALVVEVRLVCMSLLQKLLPRRESGVALRLPPHSKGGYIVGLMTGLSKAARPLPGQAYSPAKGRMRALVIGFLVALVIGFLFDDVLRNWVQQRQSPVGTKWFGAVSRFSELHYLLLILVPPFLFFQRRRDIESSRWVAAIALGCLIGGLMTLTIRCTTGRTRPCAQVEQGWYGLRHEGKWLVGSYDYNAFPSGHTGGAAGFAAVLLFRRRPGWGYALMILPIVVGFSRIYLDRHRLSDVVAAMLVGTLGAWLAVRWLRLWPPFENSK